MTNFRGFNQAQRDLVTVGLCPYCGEPIRGYTPPVGAFAPEIWESMRSKGIDPRTGHKITCGHKEVTIA
jgi:hypothetical protein